MVAPGVTFIGKAKLEAAKEQSEGNNTGQYIEYHKWLKDDTIKIKLMKMSKGYQWELTCEGEDTNAVAMRLKEADDRLRLDYGNTEDK